MAGNLKPTKPSILVEWRFGRSFKQNEEGGKNEIHDKDVIDEDR